MLWKDSVSLVNERLPGTEMYECYIDKDTSRFTMHEEYPGDEAIRRHLEVMTESGVVDRAREVLDFDFVVALGDTLDQKVRSAMGDLGFSFYELHSRAERADSTAGHHAGCSGRCGAAGMTVRCGRGR